MALACGLAFPGVCCKKQARNGGAGEKEADGKTVVAKLIVRPGTTKAMAPFQGNLEDFYDQQVSILASGELKGVAQDKAGKVAKGPNDAVTVQVARIKGSELLNLITRANSGEYAKAYAEALLDAYITKVQEHSDKAAPEVDAKEAADAEQKLKEAENAEYRYRLENGSANLDTEFDAARRKLKRLNSAMDYYSTELAMMAKTNLDLEVTRRKYPPPPPADMPEEFLRVLNYQLTPNEQAYLNAMTKADSAATAATRPQAEKDYKARIDAFKRQYETAKQLAADQEKKAAAMEASIAEGKKLTASLDAAKANYKKYRSTETQEAAALLQVKMPGVMVNVIQRPELVTVAP